MLLQVSKATKSYGADVVFSNIQFEVRGNEKIALIGRNGCGKTTLLRVIAGEEELDSGSITLSSDTTIGYLAQSAIEDAGQTVYEELLKAYAHLLRMQKTLDEMTERMATDYSESLLNQYASLSHQFEELGGYDYQAELKTVFFQFGFTEADLKKRVGEFSGGQRTKIAFVKLLLSKPDILLLDEPTNHLDLSTIEWLEGYLRHYNKAVVVVSHDRMFLDDICEVVYEMEFGSMTRFKGNYTAWMDFKKVMREHQNAAYANQQKEIERIEGQIEKFRYKKNKAAFAQSKIKYLERMEKIDYVKEDKKNFHAHFSPRTHSGNKVLTLMNYTVGYDKPLCTLTMEIKAGERIGIIGPNGKGKSTLVKSIVGAIPALSGEMLLGHQVEIGYFDQQLAQIDSDKTVVDELWSHYPNLDRTTIRTALGNFLFSGDDALKEVSVLSGGEKVRLYLARLMLQRANFLILDEPTNHLDIMGKEALEDALSDYEGTLLFVSHDRYFINKLATGIVEIDENSATYYPMNYQDYLLKKEQAKSALAPVEEVRKVREKPQRRLDYKKEIKRLEEQIEKAEGNLEELQELRFSPEYYQDAQKLNSLYEEIDEKQIEIENLYALWEEYSEIYEKSQS